MGIISEYIQKHKTEGNSNTESFHNSLKPDYIWVDYLGIFDSSKDRMKSVFAVYNTVRPHSSIDYLPLNEFEIRGE